MEKTSEPTDTWWKKVRHKLGSVWKFMSLPFRICNWLRKHWKSAIFVGIFGIALSMMIGASFTLSGAQLVTVLLIGSILVLFTFVKMLYDFLKVEAKRTVEGESLRKEKIALADKVARLKGELQMERSGGIKVRIHPILQMVFLEAECEVTKFFSRYFDENDNEIAGDELAEDELAEDELRDVGPDSQKKRPEKRFLGGLTAKFRAKYGVDFHKVYVKPDEQTRTLFVSGAEPSFIGVRGYPEMRWEGSVALTRGLWNKWVIDGSVSPKLELECREKYREALQKSLTNGPEQLEWVKEPLRRNIKRLLKIIARDYRVEMVDRPREGFIPLSEYLRRLGLEGPDQLFLP